MKSGINFAVWGVGIRGNLAVKFLGIDNIAVFIDENCSVQGCTYCGREVISFREYQDRFSECYIIISPNDFLEIEEKLKKNKIKNYDILDNIVY